jgi:hypothetical protein
MIKKGRKEGSGKNYKGVYYTYFKNIKDKAAERGIPFNITIEQVGDLWEKNPICPYSGVSLTQKKSSTDKCYTASLDRIDPSKGYQPKNVQWVWKSINKMKSDFTHKEFDKILNTIIENGIKKLHPRVKNS